MNREKFSEDAYLYLLNELSREDKIEFENILMQDDLLNREFQAIKNEFALIAAVKPKEVDDKRLTSARNALMRELKKEASKTSFIANMLNNIKNFFYHNYGLAFGGVATFALGIGIGYTLLVSRSVEKNLKPENPIEISGIQHETQPAELQDKINSENLQSSINREPASNLTEKDFGVQRNLKDELINNLIAQPNAGVRIRSISTLSDQAQAGRLKPDAKIKRALVTAMQKDKNPVVRRQAMNVLSTYPYDEDLRDALLYVLSNDENSGNRVAAINALMLLRERGVQIDQVMKQTLTNKAMADKNTFVKIRAASILKED